MARRYSTGTSTVIPDNVGNLDGRQDLRYNLLVKNVRGMNSEFPSVRPVLLIMGVLLVGRMTGAGESPGTRYADREYGYSLAAPAGWSRKSDMPRPYVAFLGPEDHGFQANFNIYSEPAANKTLADYVKVSRETIAKSKEMRLQSDRKATLGGSPAVVLQSLVTATGHPPSIARQIVTVRGGRGYIVTFTTRPAALKKYLPVFEKVQSSFRWQH